MRNIEAHRGNINGFDEALEIHTPSQNSTVQYRYCIDLPQTRERALFSLQIRLYGSPFFHPSYPDRGMSGCKCDHGQPFNLADE